MSKKAERPSPKYIVSQKQAMASLTALPLASSKVSQSEKKFLQLAIIGAVPFQYLTRQKDVKIFAILMQNMYYQLNKDKKPPTNHVTKVPKCYHDFLDVFSKEASKTISAHLQYNYVICLLGEKDHGQATLRAMLKKKLAFIKNFLEDNLKKNFIKVSHAPCSSPIILAVKPGGGIRFYIDYQKLNKLTKKNTYSIPLIAETLA